MEYPEVDYRRQLSGLPLLFDIGLYNHDIKASLRFTVSFRYGHIAYENNLPDTVLWGSSTGKSINGIMNDIGIYIGKDLFRIRNNPFGIELGFMFLNNGSKVYYSYYTETNGWKMFVSRVHDNKFNCMSANFTYDTNHLRLKIGANYLEDAVMEYKNVYADQISIRISATYKIPLGKIFESNQNE